MQTFQIIAAVSDNEIVGCNNQIPWTKEQVPRDLPHFMRQTLDGAIIMGKKTFESIGSKPLKKRVNIVVSTTLSPIEGIHVVQDFTAAVELAKEIFIDEFQEDYPTSIIGGYRLWKEALQSEFVTKALITRIHAKFEGDTVFPEEELRESFGIFYKDKWTEKEEGKISSTFQLWKRRE